MPWKMCKAAGEEHELVTPIWYCKSCKRRFCSSSACHGADDGFISLCDDCSQVEVEAEKEYGAESKFREPLWDGKL